MIKRISKYKGAFKIFAEYLNNKGINPNDFFTKLNTRIQYVIVLEWCLFDYYIVITKYKDFAIIKIEGFSKDIAPFELKIVKIVFNQNELEESYKIVAEKIFEIIESIDITIINEHEETPF